MAKFHEERGKIKCDCWQCQANKEIRELIKQETKEQREKKQCLECQKWFKKQCLECQKWFKELDQEHGICEACVENYK